MSPGAAWLNDAQRALHEQRRLRSVRQARLTAGSAVQAQALRRHLHDALERADFGDSGRIVLVRRLQLPRLAAGAGAVAFTAAIERAWRSLADSAVHALDPRAARAPAVWFASAAELRLHWLRCNPDDDADRTTVAARAWFWPLALPELVGVPLRSARGQVLRELAALAPRVCAGCLLALPPAARADWVQMLPPAWVAEMLADDAQPSAHRAEASAPTTLAALPDEAPPELFPDDSEFPRSASRVIRAEVPHGSAPPEARAASDRRPASQRREQGSEAPTRAAPARARSATPLPAQIWSSVRAEHAAESQVRDLAPSTVAAEPIPAPHDEHVAVADADADTDTHVDARSESPVLAAVPLAVSPPASPALRALAPWWRDARASDCGGFLMLVHALGLLGFGAWLDARRGELPQDFVAQLMERLARRVGLPAEDPHRALWPTPCAALSCAHAADRERWYWQLRRALRREAGIGLWSLVHRQAWLSVTDTHADLLLPLDTVDLRIRRAALDANPGWVPWFGRVLSLQFFERGH